jgi:hypothetical protein
MILHAFQINQDVQFTVGPIGLLVGLILLRKTYGIHGLRMAVAVITLSMLSSACILSMAILDWALEADKISLVPYRILFNIMLYGAMVGACSDYIIAFKYL